MVPHDQLGRVAGMNQTLQGAMRIVSPPLGALLVALLPLHAILAIDVATAAIAIGPLLVLGIPQPDRAPAAEHTVRARARGLVRDVADGFRYIWEWRWLKVVVAMAIVANVVFNPAFSLLALVVTKHYGGGALQLGWLNSAFGIGVVLGGLILTAWGGFRIRGYSIALGLLGMGVGVLAVGVAPAGWLWLGIGGMWLAGVGSPIANGPIAALMQTSVKPDMQGRGFTAMDSLVSLASPLGMAVAGPVADAIGPEKWFAIAGAVCLGIVLLIVAKPSLLCRVDERPADAGVSAGAAMVQ
jgi:DHA3 family macrolide efflux protein-like MFS transporter